jgi:hypothetical protein
MSITINSILFMDDPDHRRLRSLVSKPFICVWERIWRVSKLKRLSSP